LSSKPARKKARKAKPTAKSNPRNVREHILWWLGTLGPVIAVLIAIAIILAPRSTEFILNTEAWDSITIKYSRTNHNRISPACGCINVDVPRWRGVTIVSNSLVVSVPPGAEAYALWSGTLPGPLSVIGGTPLRGTQMVVGIPKGTAFDPANFGRSTADSTHFKMSDSLRSFNIDSFTDAPIVSITPARGSSISLDPRSGDLGYKINEIYGSKQYSKNFKEYVRSAAILDDLDDYTIVDIVGRDILVWRYDDDLIPSNTVDKLVYVVRVKLPYSLRVAIARPRIGPGEPQLSISLKKSPLTTEQWAKFRQRLDKDSTFVIQTSAEAPISTESFMAFRLPPLPDNDGLNIFGQPLNVSIAGVEGSFTFGAQSKDVPGPSDVELIDIEPVNSNNEKVAIPIKIEGSRVVVNKKMNSKAKILVNGHSVVRGLDISSDWFAALSTAVFAIGGAGWLLRRWQAYRAVSGLRTNVG
jgi:hypothetical protein